MRTDASRIIFGTSLTLAAAWLLGALGACNQSGASSAEAASEVTTTAAATAAQPGKATKIVFVGNESDCPCTMRRVNNGWQTLQKALGNPAALPLERLNADTQAQQVEPLRKKRPYMALPAVYFLDAKDNVVELMQGFVRQEQVKVVLDRS